MSRYGIVLHEAAYREIPKRTAARQRILAAVEGLAANPFGHGNFQSMDEVGRTIEISVCGKFKIRWWADHAAQEVRVVSITPIH